MIGLKDILKTKEGLDKINSSIQEQTKIIKENKKELEVLQKQNSESISSLKEFSKQQNTLLAKSEELISHIHNAAHEMQKELDDLKVMKSRMQNKIMDEVTTSFKKEIGSYVEDLRKEIDSYRSAKKVMDESLKEIQNVKGEFEKFNSVASQIKAGDFELTKFANKVFAEDRNKLELLKRIDTLEKVIANQRRNSQRR